MLRRLRNNCAGEKHLIDLHLTKLRARDDVSSEEEADLRAAVSECRSYRADQLIVRQHVKTTECVLLISGFAGCFKDLRSGERQITKLQIGGDFLDLHGLTLKPLDHNIIALTSCTVAVFPHAALHALTEKHAHLTRLLWFQTNLDAAVQREWEVSLGRRTAVQRLAHLFCEMQARMALVGLDDARGFAFPLTQTDLAECTGLTSVHVNRTLKELRERGLVEVRGGRVDIHDLAALRTAGEFDPTYLYLDRCPV